MYQVKQRRLGEVDDPVAKNVLHSAVYRTDRSIGIHQHHDVLRAVDYRLGPALLSEHGTSSVRSHDCPPPR